MCWPSKSARFVNELFHPLRVWGDTASLIHYDVMKWKYCPRYRPFVRGNHRSPVKYSHKGQWRRALMLMCAWENGWANSRDAGDWRRHCTHRDVTLMKIGRKRVWQFSVSTKPADELIPIVRISQWHIMSIMASKIIGASTVCSIVRSCQK